MRKTVRPTDIEWATHTWSPIIGCEHGCSFCYARDICRRFGMTKAFGHCELCRDFEVHLHEERFLATWPKKPSVVFLDPLSDWWSPGVPQEWRDRAFSEIMRAKTEGAPMDAVALTKFPERFTTVDRDWFCWLSGHLWVGVSVTGPEDEWRWPVLCESVPWGRRILSMEPLLYDGAWAGLLRDPDWLIIGPRTPARQAADIRVQVCAEKAVRGVLEGGVPVFVKPAAAKAWPGVPIVQEWPEAMYCKPAERGQGA